MRWDHAADALETATAETVALLDADIRRMLRTRNMLAAALAADGTPVSPFEWHSCSPPSRQEGERPPEVINYRVEEGRNQNDPVREESHAISAPIHLGRSHALLIDSIAGRVVLFLDRVGDRSSADIGLALGMKSSSVCATLTRSSWFVKKGRHNAPWGLTEAGREAAAKLKSMTSAEAV